MKQTTTKRLLVTGILIGLLLIPAWFAYRLGIIPRIDRLQSFHAPVFGPDGREVFYLTRNARSISWGSGIEFFSPPAAVIVISDRFLLQRTSIEAGETDTIHTWPADHPLKPNSSYRNYLFGIPDCDLRWEGRTLHYRIGLDFLPNDPPIFSVPEWTTGSWNADTKSLIEKEHWKSGHEQTNRWTEQLLSGPFEIVDYKGQALILYDSATGARRQLRVSKSAGSRLREELETADLKEYTHRAELERSRTIQNTYSGLVSMFRSQGLRESEAMLRANDEMEKLGYYPMTPKLIAHKVYQAPPGVNVFKITGDEFRFGLFPDIEKAVANPGIEVHFGGNYITHRDFNTSRKLNEYLAAGNTRFVVQSEKGLFLLKFK